MAELQLSFPFFILTITTAGSRYVIASLALPLYKEVNKAQVLVTAAVPVDSR